MKQILTNKVLQIVYLGFASVLSCVVFVCGVVPIARATDYSSSNFIVRDPVISVHGGYSSSASFQTFVSSGQTIIGENLSTSFIQRAGFLYFAVVTAPVVTPTAGDGQVTLNWTASQAYLGESVASYVVGQSTASGGPYTFTDVGNTLSSVRNGLTNGATYYFIIEARNSVGDNLVRSGEVSSTPQAGASQPGTSSGSNTANAATFSGQTGPGQVVSILNGHQLVGTITAAASGNFSKTITGLTPGQYTFSLYGTDSRQRRTSLYSVTITVPPNSSATVANIILSPTVSVSASQIKQGDDIVFSGQTVPSATVQISISPGSTSTVVAGADGNFSYSLNTASMQFGSYSARAVAQVSPQLFSNPSFPVPFSVGDKTIDTPTAPVACGDFNQDGYINLIDFSILIYWFDKSNPPARVDCNHDNVINLVDFSILLYYWTG